MVDERQPGNESPDRGEAESPNCQTKPPEPTKLPSLVRQKKKLMAESKLSDQLKQLRRKFDETHDQSKREDDNLLLEPDVQSLTHLLLASQLASPRSLDPITELAPASNPSNGDGSQRNEKPIAKKIPLVLLDQNQRN